MKPNGTPTINLKPKVLLKTKNRTKLGKPEKIEWWNSINTYPSSIQSMDPKERAIKKSNKGKSSSKSAPPKTNLKPRVLSKENQRQTQQTREDPHDETLLNPISAQSNQWIKKRAIKKNKQTNKWSPVKRHYIALITTDKTQHKTHFKPSKTR